MAEVTRALRRRHDDGRGPIVLLAEVQHAQRFGDDPRALMVIDGDGRTSEGPGIAAGVVPEGYCDPAEVPAGGSVFMHVPAHEHAKSVGRS